MDFDTPIELDLPSFQAGRVPLAAYPDVDPTELLGIEFDQG